MWASDLPAHAVIPAQAGIQTRLMGHYTVGPPPAGRNRCLMRWKSESRTSR